MDNQKDIQKTSEKLLDFAEFFMRLGDLKGQDMLLAIAERDPEFTWYVETVNDRIETMLDFFRVYAEWGVDRLRKECGESWAEVVGTCAACRNYELLRLQYKDMTALWDEWQRVVGR